MLTSGSGIDPDLHYILDGVVNGFHVVDPDADLEGYECKNYSSCFTDNNEKKMCDIIEGEFCSGKLSLVNNIPKCVHALGAVRKRGSCKIRPITDCSRPELSVNNYMERVQDGFSYVTISRIVSSIIEGNYTYMSTVDLASAYRSVLISPMDRPFFGIKWEDKYFVDNFLCFGSRAAPFIFSRLTDSVCRYMVDRGVRCFSYLDDVICLSRSFEEGVRDQLFLIHTIRRLGFFIAWNKVTSPSPVTTYLGIVLDIDRKQLSLPVDRLERVRAELAFWDNRKKATEKQLSILIGHLCHCAKIIRGGSLYLFFLFEALRESKKKRKIKLSKNFHSDLSWWRLSLDLFNFLPMIEAVSSDRQIVLESGYHTVLTDLGNFTSELDWPCVRIYTEYGIDRIDLSLSQDDTVGFNITSDGLDLSLPEFCLFDDSAQDICGLWCWVMAHDYTDCGLTVCCKKRSTWLCLKKSRHKNDMVAFVLRHLFWWAMRNNVKFKFVYVM